MKSRWRRSESDTAVKIRKVFEHLKHGKVKKDQLLIVFLVGILLLVISIPAGTKKDSNTGTKKTGSRRHYQPPIRQKAVSERQSRVSIQLIWKNDWNGFSPRLTGRDRCR